MKKAVELAYDRSSKDEDTLKLFLAPEFFFRGRKGAYNTSTMFDISAEELVQSAAGTDSTENVHEINMIARALETLVQQAKYKDWLFVFGTVVSSQRATDADCQAAKRECDDKRDLHTFLNFAPVYRG